MFVPIYEDEFDEYKESTYKVLKYDDVGRTVFLYNDKESLTTQIENITCRPIEELISSQAVFLHVRGEHFSLENTLEEDTSDFVGEEITVECF